MKNWKQFMAVAVIAIFGIIVITCDNETSDLVCNCPNGTLHLVGEMCCEGVDCNCEKEIVGQRVEGIPVTNRQGVDNISNIVWRLEIAFDDLRDNPTWIPALKNKVKEIRIVPGTGAGSHAVDGVKYIITIYANTSASDMGEILYYCAIDTTL